jgi:hypothetical protein
MWFEGLWLSIEIQSGNQNWQPEKWDDKPINLPIKKEGVGTTPP